MLKQKAKFFSIFAGVLLFVSFALPLFVFSSDVHAEYAPGSDNKCQDGSNAIKRTNRLTHATEYYCADSTKKTTTTTTTTTPAAGGAASADGTATGSNGEEQSVSCAVEKIGWIVCPVMESAAKISDKAFEILGDNFLRVDPELVKDDSGTKVGWEVARNLANIMFIIAFLIIILSQVTGRGLNNYGIKKMLPRLIIAAIAVNLSYYICQLVVDLTNILGYEIQNALTQIANTVGPSVFGSAANYSDTEQGGAAVFQNGTLMTIIVTGALAAGAVVFFMLPTIIALVPLILITVMTIIIILLLRKALIVLLIVISPIAFVLYLLPNTEKYFSKWMSMFGKLLMVFPIVGMLFGAGQLASTIILVAGSDGNQALAAMQCNPDNEEEKKAYNDKKTAGNSSLCGEKPFIIKGGKDGNDKCFSASDKCGVNNQLTANWTLGLVAMGVAVAPLLAVWGVLQGALSAAGAIGGKITSAVSKGMSGAGKPLNGAGAALSKRVKEDRDGMWQRSQARGADGNGKYPWDNVAGGFARRRGNRALRQNLTKSALSRAENHAGEGNIENLLGGLSDEEVKRARRAIKAQEDQHAAEEVKNALTAIEYADAGKVAGGVEALKAGFAGKGDATQAKAAMQALTASGELGINKLFETLAEAEKTADKKFLDGMKEYMLQAHGNVKEKHAGIGEWMKHKSTDKLADGTADPNAGRTLTDFTNDGASYAGLSDKQFASQSAASLNSAGAQAALGMMSATADGGQESRAYRLLSNPEHTGELSDSKRASLAGKSIKI